MPASLSYTMDGRPRARGLGIPLSGTPGPSNAITDVAGVEVGYKTLVRGEGLLRSGQGPVRTGVTAILPRGRERPVQPCAAGWFALNGNGEMTGTSWIEEVGALSTPVLITNTHAVGSCHQGAIDWMVGGAPAGGWVLPVVAETFDGYLNDINSPHVRPEHAVSALESAVSGPIEEGSVGGGTGMNCYGFKGGSGTASRVVRHGADEYVIGTFVQANFGARRHLSVMGQPVGLRIEEENPMEDRGWLAPPGAGSVIVVVGTDAPLLPGQCKALARRVPLGLARTGTIGSHFSGDLFLAFSTANAGALSSEFNSSPGGRTYETLRFVPWGGINAFYEATIQCVEEAVLNALIVNETMVGRDGHQSPALPHDELLRCLREGNVNLRKTTS